MNLRNRTNRRNAWKYLIIALSFLFVSSTTAQKLQLTEGMVNYKGEQQASITATVEPGTKNIKSALKDWMQEQFSVDLKGYGFFTNKAILSAKGVIIPTISNKRIDFFARVTPSGDKSQIQFFSSFGPEVPINEVAYPETYHALEELALDFLDDFLPEWYRSRIAEAQEVVGDLRKERERLIKDRQDSQGEIQDLRKEVLDIEEEIATTSQALDAAENNLNDELTALHTVGHQLEGKRSTLNYIVVLDRSYFPSLKTNENEQDSDPTTRRSPASQENYEKRVENHLYSFAKDELNLAPKKVTQIYSATLLGFAVEIDSSEKEQFLQKAEKLKAIKRVEKDQKVGIF